MNRNKLLAILTAVSVSACLYACGSDDDSQPNNNAGASGKAGGGGSGGKAGSSNTAGKGGSGNQAGESGATGDSGSGGVAGSAEGGAGGDQNVAGDTGISGAGGDGGAGGAAPALTLSEACTAACVPAHNVTSCSTTVEVCIASCTSYNDDWVVAAGADEAVAKTLNADYLAVISCAAEHLSAASQYACAASSGPTVNAWSPTASTACEAALCKWTCADFDNSVAAADEAVYNRCACH